MNPNVTCGRSTNFSTFLLFHLQTRTLIQPFSAALIYCGPKKTNFTRKLFRGRVRTNSRKFIWWLRARKWTVVAAVVAVTAAFQMIFVNAFGLRINANFTKISKTFKGKNSCDGILPQRKKLKLCPIK